MNDKEDPPAVVAENPKQAYIRLRAGFSQYETAIMIWLVFLGFQLVFVTLDFETWIKIDAVLGTIPSRILDMLVLAPNYQGGGNDVWTATLGAIAATCTFFLVPTLLWFLLAEAWWKRGVVEKKLQLGENIRRRETQIVACGCQSVVFLWLGLALLIAFSLFMTPRVGIYQGAFRAPSQNTCAVTPVVRGGGSSSAGSSTQEPFRGYAQTWHFHPFQHVGWADAPARKGILLGVFDAPKEMNPSDRTSGDKMKLLLFNTDMSAHLPGVGPAEGCCSSTTSTSGGRTTAIDAVVTKEDAFRIFFQYLEVCFFVDLALRMAAAQFPHHKIIAQVGGSFHFDPGRMQAHALDWLVRMVRIIETQNTSGISQAREAGLAASPIDSTTPMLFMLNMFGVYPQHGLVVGEHQVTRIGSAFPWPLLRAVKHPICVAGGGVQADRGMWNADEIDVFEARHDLSRCLFGGTWLYKSKDGKRQIAKFDRLQRSDFSFTVPRGSMTRGQPNSLVQTADIQSDVEGRGRTI